MAEFIYEGGGSQYTLRASGPMPVYGAGAGGKGPEMYVIHSFGADVSSIDIYECTETLLASTEFAGQGGSLNSANFSSLGDKDGKVFQGRAIHYPEFSEEDSEDFNQTISTCVGHGTAG